MQEVLVRLWCDMTLAQSGERVQSDEQVELVFRRAGKEVAVRLDLTAAHADNLAAGIAPYLAAGSEIGAPPVFRHGFRPGSKEAREWRKGLRDWADSAGRTGEYLNPNATEAKNRFRYPDQLVRDYQEHLLAKARAA